MRWTLAEVDFLEVVSRSVVAMLVNNWAAYKDSDRYIAIDTIFHTRVKYNIEGPQGCELPCDAMWRLLSAREECARFWLSSVWTMMSCSQAKAFEDLYTNSLEASWSSKFQSIEIYIGHWSDVEIGKLELSCDEKRWLSQSNLGCVWVWLQLRIETVHATALIHKIWGEKVRISNIKGPLVPTGDKSVLGNLV